jgi:hypothetical protein
MTTAVTKFKKNTTDFFDALALFPDRLRDSAPEGEWSAAFIVHHVADCELHFAARYLSILGSDNPTMIYFDEDRYPDALHYEGRTIAKSLASIMGIRAVILEILTSINESAWSRQTTAEDGKSYTLAQLVDQADGHMQGHIEQLAQLRGKIS